MKFLYGRLYSAVWVVANIRNYSTINTQRIHVPSFPHEHCVDKIAPSSFLHIGEKFLQMASTNCVDAGHFNTHRLACSLTLSKPLVGLSARRAGQL